MGNPPTHTPDETQATEALARLGVAASRLGIETFWLEVAAKRLGSAPATYMRVWLDTEVPRLAVRCEEAGALGERPARARYVELDSDGGEYHLAAGTRMFADDRAVIEQVATAAATDIARTASATDIARAARVPASALDAIARQLDAFGDGRCDALGRVVGGTVWTATLVESEPTDLPGRAARLGALARELGVTPLQLTLLEDAHVVLGTAGYTLTFTADRTGMRPHVTLEYRGVPWKRVVGLTDALRPGTSSGRALGIFAGALEGREASQASGLAITYRAGTTAHVRVAIDRESDFV